MDFNAMLNRVIRAARLDVSLYNEVEADTSLNREALTVVIIVSISGSRRQLCRLALAPGRYRACDPRAGVGDHLGYRGLLCVGLSNLVHRNAGLQGYRGAW